MGVDVDVGVGVDVCECVRACVRVGGVWGGWVGVSGVCQGV